MSKTFLGDACADMGKPPGAEKRRYVRIGSAFRDDTHGSVSIKIDSLPLPGDTWNGWINIFERDASGYEAAARATAARDAAAKAPLPRVTPRQAPLAEMDDDIPF